MIYQSTVGHLLSLAALCALALAEMPLPWTRELYYIESSPMKGNDVIIMQNLINRDESVRDRLEISGVFDADSARAVKAFQFYRKMEATGVFNEETAAALLDCCSDDGVTDTGFTAASLGYKYKIYLPVYYNRSIETYATLYDAVGNEVMKFRTRSHGWRDDGQSRPWPDYSNDVGLNEFTSDGNTVTGILELDLNSPEPNPDVYGPWPVNRVVRGLEGNGAFLLPNIRDGILIHTGNWPDWDETMDMPNSSGCMHTHPDDCEALYLALVDMGVEIRENPFSGKNYPYEPQGVMVIELIE